MAFKTATVNAASVAAPLTDFPAYVDLSRLGITTLAEAESVRVYADEGKTTELAREIVSAVEMHVKIPSLTTSTEIYVDWDGVRADYDPADTYGRNAVWSDWQFVSHDGGLTDASGNFLPSNNGSTVGDAKLGAGGREFDGSNDNITIGSLPTMTRWTLQAWSKPSAFLSDQRMISNDRGGWNDDVLFGLHPEGGRGTNGHFGAVHQDNNPNVRTIVNSPSKAELDQWYLVHAVSDSSTLYLYVDGSMVDFNAKQATDLTYDGAVTTVGSSPGGGFYDGHTDEVRIKAADLSANWITTEYNNQNDESTFWGTWTDAGGDPTPTPTGGFFNLMRL